MFGLAYIDLSEEEKPWENFETFQ